MDQWYGHVMSEDMADHIHVLKALNLCTFTQILSGPFVIRKFCWIVDMKCIATLLQHTFYA